MNTPERYRRAQEVFLAACELDKNDRARFLERACADDSTLGGELDRLLAADTDVEEFLQTQELGGWDSGGGPHPERIGGYELVEVLGQGGMGTVYKARQSNPNRTVALKVIRPGAVSKPVLRRMEHEAHLLGRLQHPGIAQIFEAGTFASSAGAQPYFAMELVDGQPITQ
jgi:serine/threonine protein kinase